MKPIWMVVFSMVLAGGMGVDCVQAADSVDADAAPGAAVYIISPFNGETVGETFTVRFGLRGMGVAPAGIEREHTGHHHLLIDSPVVDFNQSLPATRQVQHFGGGQTEAVISLTPGIHQLQLLLGNYLHIPHAPPVISEVITVNVMAAQTDSKD